MELHLTEEIIQRLLEIFPSKIVPIQSMSIDGHRLYLNLAS